jgi:hypothetical protein
LSVRHRLVGFPCEEPVRTSESESAVGTGVDSLGSSVLLLQSPEMLHL